MENKGIPKIVVPSPGPWREEGIGKGCCYSSLLAESSSSVGNVYEGVRGKAGNKPHQALLGKCHAGKLSLNQQELHLLTQQLFQ